MAYRGVMEMERRIVGLLSLLLFLLAACTSQPTPLTEGGGVDLSDPNVGGGVGIALPEETPEPLPTPTQEVAPRPTTLAAIPQPTDTIATVVVPTATNTQTAPSIEEPSPSPTTTPVEPTPLPEATAETEPAEPTSAGESAESEPIATEERPTVHIVEVGENLYRIGLRYGISYIALAEYNGIPNVDQVAVGQEIRIPPLEDTEDTVEEPEAESTQEAETATPTPPAAPTEQPVEATPTTTPVPEPEAEGTISATPSAGRTHTVQPGENLYRISQQYDVSWVLIAEANGLISPNQITVGQVLKIPTDAPGPDPQITHQVRSGESLFRIALQYGVPLSLLVEANSLQAPYVIYPGQVLVIPSDE
ncbi:MAG: LysM peptidoglycan-binding domain-containing protein [Chloroflexota bacterium]